MIKTNDENELYSKSGSGDPSRPKVLLLAYSISPIRGSEYSVGWNHVRHLAEFCDLTVLYGLSGPHMGDLNEIEEYLRTTRELASVRFVPIRPNILARLLNAPNRAGILIYSFYLAYRIWHWQAARVARKIIASEPIDLIHYLCPIGYREPGYLWKLRKPFIWGPIGGLPPTLHLRGAPRPQRTFLKAKLKNLANRVNLATANRVSRALNRAETVIAATSANRRMLWEHFGVTSLLIQENAIPDDAVRYRSRPSVPPGQPLRIIWIGSLDWRKSPDLLLDALASVKSKRWTIDIVGGGKLRPLVEARVEQYGLSNQVTLHGTISRIEVQNLLQVSNLHIVTSMGEGNPTTVWEAMAAGVPTLTLDHCGMHDVVCDTCGVRIPTTNYAGTRDRIALEVESLIEDRQKLTALENGVIACRKQFLWSGRTKQWLYIYRRAIGMSMGD